MRIAKLVRRAVETVPPHATCTEAAQRMRDAEVGSGIVVEGGRPRGILTDRDLVVRVIAAGQDPAKLGVGEVMSRKPIFVLQTRDVACVLGSRSTRPCARRKSRST